MAAKKWNLAKLFAALEVAFATDPDADGSDYKFIKAHDIVFSPEAEVIERPGQTGTMTRQPHVIGGKGGRVTWKMELKASGTPAGDATPAIAAESSPILEASLGAVVRGTGTTVGAASGNGAAGTPLKVASTAGLSVGMLIEVAGEQRFVAEVINATDVELDRALSANPAAATPVYASSKFYRTDSGHKSVALVGFRDDVQYTFLGCHVRAKLAGTNARGTPILECEAAVGTWSRSAKANLPAAEVAGITAVKAPVVKGAPFVVDGAEKLVSGLEFDPGQEFAFQESTAAADNKSGIELVGASPQGNFRPYYNDEHIDDFVDGTEKTLVFTCGDRTNGFGIFIPRAQYLQPTLEDRNGMVGESVPFVVNDNGSAPEYFIAVF